ncbi:recombinase family protein [Vreelandella populi]|uniref:recombinase family protein n=1 Tax=Vreelandella populi TaxID=2498858 RepID=UPI003BF4AEE3
MRGRAAQVNPGGFTTPARRPSVPHRTAGCGKSSLRPLMAGSSPSLPDGSNPSAAIVQSASDVQCSRLLKTTHFESLNEKIETSSATGKLVFHVFAALAEFERCLIRDRTQAGLAAARARGRAGGRKPKLDKQQVKEIKSLLRDPDMQVTDVARRYGVSRTTLYKYIGVVSPRQNNQNRL